MRAGTLRHRITIEQPAETQNAHGEPVVTWSALATCWASVEPLSGRELLMAQQVNAEITHRARLRYVAGVMAKQRVQHQGRYFDINAVRNIDERKVELELLCQEAV